MAHLVSSDVLVPGFEGRQVAVTEDSKELSDFTFEDVEFSLRLLAYMNTNYSKTAAELDRSYGLTIHPNTLRRWVSSSFTQRYVEIQHELAEEVNKKLAAKTVDMAAKAVEAEELILDRVVSEVKDIDVDKLPAAASSMAKTASTNIEDSQLLRDRPTQIIKHRNPDDAIKFLREKGLISDDDVREAEDVEEVKDEDA